MNPALPNWVKGQKAESGKTGANNQNIGRKTRFAKVSSNYFPEIVSDAVERLRGSELQNARPALIRAFVDQLCFGYADSSSPYFEKRPAIIAIDAVIELHRQTALPRLIDNMNKLLKNPEPDAVYIGCAIALRMTEAGEAVDNAGKTVLKSWIENLPQGADRGNILKRGIQIEWLRANAIGALSSLDSTDFGGINGNIPPEILSQAAIHYSSADNWEQANLYASEFAIKFAPNFSEEDLDLIFSAAESGKADLRGSHGFKNFISALFTENEKRTSIVETLLGRHNLMKYKSTIEEITD